MAGNGAAVLRKACRLSFEGIVSKRADSRYEPGRRAGWLKAKCTARQEFVIGGFTDPQGSRVGIGALLVGYYDRDGHLRFAGKVGTGFTTETARKLRSELERIEVKACPFVPPPAGRLGRNAHWVRPALVAEVAFTEWTAEGKIRHPSFQGLRLDKHPREIKRERPGTPRRQSPRARAALRLRAPTRRSDVVDAGSDRGTVTISGVRITHPNRVLFPAARVTKEGLARYYEGIADWIVPHVEDRALTLVRCPAGVSGGCFYMKHSKVWAPDSLRRVRIREKTKIGDYLIADDIAGIIGLVQMDILEIHTWNSRFAHVETPDRLVFDIDPGEQVPWRRTVEAARFVRKALESLDLVSFVKTTGGKGLHVVVPLAPRHDWERCLEFSRAVAEAIVRADPAVYTTTFAKAGRANKILIDYLRNNRTNTSVAAFSTRAKPEATVSMPLRWEELTPALHPDRFTVLTVPRHLARRKDAWQAYWRLKQRISAAALTRGTLDISAKKSSGA